MQIIELLPASTKLSSLVDRCTLSLDSVTLSSLATLDVISGPSYYDGMREESEYFSLCLGDFLESLNVGAPYGEMCSETPSTAEIGERISITASAPFDVDNSVAYSLVHAGRRHAI